MASKTEDVTVRIQQAKLTSRDTLTEIEFNTMMQTGLMQAQMDDAVSAKEAFDQLKTEI